MVQLSFFTDIAKRLEKLDTMEARDPLAFLNEVVDWEMFRPHLEEALGLVAQDGKPKPGRPAWDPVLMFKILVLCTLYNLSDDQVEFQVADRLSFQRFLGIAPDGKVPDSKSVWRFRERLKEAEAFDDLFDIFGGYLDGLGYRASGGQIVDAQIIPVPRQRNTREENATIKAGGTPEGWKPAKRRRKDTEARTGVKHGQPHFGYKKHNCVDRVYKLVRNSRTTHAAVHDGQVMGDVIDLGNDSPGVWADSAYRSAENEGMLADWELESQVHERAWRETPLTEEQKESNRIKSKVRARVEHPFGSQVNDLGGVMLRSVGLARAEVGIIMQNLCYNMRRLVFLELRAPKPG